MSVTEIAYIGPKQPQYNLEKGHFYTVYLPSSKSTYIPSGASSSTSPYSQGLLTVEYRQPGVQRQIFIFESCVYKFDGNKVKTLKIGQSDLTAYILEDVEVQMAYNRLYDPHGSGNISPTNYHASVAASTARTSLPSVSIPYGRRVTLQYVLSIGGDLATAGSDLEVGIITGATAGDIIIHSGSLSGEIDVSESTSSVAIRYANEDTVAHWVFAQFQFVVIQ